MFKQEVEEYMEHLGKALQKANAKQPLLDEEVWLEIFKSTIGAPTEFCLMLDKNNVTATEFADKCLVEFKKRFRKDANLPSS